MGRVSTIVGNTYGNLTVLARKGDRMAGKRYLVRCTCGHEEMHSYAELVLTKRRTCCTRCRPPHAGNSPGYQPSITTKLSLCGSSFTKFLALGEIDAIVDYIVSSAVTTGSPEEIFERLDLGSPKRFYNNGEREKVKRQIMIKVKAILDRQRNRFLIPSADEYASKYATLEVGENNGSQGAQ